MRAPLFLAGCLFALPVAAQPPQRAIAALPACNDEMHYAALWVTDAANADDCTMGGGTERVWCRCNGTWSPMLLTGPAGPEGPQGPPGESGSADPCAAWPVDSLFFSASAVSPAVLLGCGVWTPYGAGRVPVAIDVLQPEFDTLGETGGEKAHALTVAEMPAHVHVQTLPSGQSGGQASGTRDASTNGSTADSLSTAGAGGGAAHNNLQPFIVISLWRRTA